MAMLNMRFFRVRFDDGEFDDRYFLTAEAAHAALTREGFGVANVHWPDTWTLHPDPTLPSYVIHALGEYVEIEDAVSAP
jgi:hypothetical protein